MTAKRQISSKNTRLSVEGIVIRNTGSAYLVKTAEGDILPCRIKGNFRIKGLRTTNPIAVGDIVEVSKAADDAFHIIAIRQRKNYIIRKSSNLSKESHILAANLDQAFLVVTIFNPETSTTFIDRFLATAEAYSIPVVLVFNKCDTWTPEILEYASKLKDIYRKIGYESLFTSTITGEGIPQLKDLANGKISLLAGNSGVGKSSLINSLVPGINLKTGDISDTHHTGMHTTTFSEMIELPGGGSLIDIPGIKGFGTLEFEPSQVSHYFPEIFKIGDLCKYNNCRHLGEPGCAVMRAVENGDIASSRFNSYLSIMEESDQKKDEDKYRKPF